MRHAIRYPPRRDYITSNFMTNESIVVISSAAVTVLTLLISSYFSNRKLQITLEQARLDRIADKGEILDAGAVRKNQIVNEVKQVKTVAVKSALKSEQAINAANNVTEKSDRAVEIAVKALEKVSGENKETKKGRTA